MSPNGGESRLDRIERMMESIAERQSKTEEMIAAGAARQDKADSQMTAIRKLMQVGMKMLAKQDERITHIGILVDQIAASQLETQATLRAFIESMKKGSNGHA